MKFLLSPAKLMDLKSKALIEDYSQPIFIKESERINSVLNKFKPEDYALMMDISQKLATEVWENQCKWKPYPLLSNGLQAVFAFKGEVYKAINPNTLSIENLNKLNEKGFIISGLYGLLKPLDIIMPYRLEMGTRFKINQCKNLYDFWGDKITNEINRQSVNDKYLINLTSNEYFRGINKSKLKIQVIDIKIMEDRNGELIQIMNYFKQARGKIARFIAENSINSLDDLKLFNEDGYQFNEKLSLDNLMVWTRQYNPKKK